MNSRALSTLAVLLFGACTLAHAQAPAGATGQCNDGTYSTAPSKAGACSGHKGVKTWYSATTPTPSSPKPSPAAAAPAGPAPSGSTGQCKDGTYSSAASKDGACRGHQGVKTWFAASPSKPMPAPAAPPPPPTATSHPASAPAPARTTPAPGGGNGQVWVNTETKVYHCSGDRYYGKTKQGSYMSQSDAQSKGFRPDAGKPCPN